MASGEGRGLCSERAWSLLRAWPRSGSSSLSHASAPRSGLQVHTTLELLALTVVVFELCMKLRWLGLHTFIRHKRTMVKVRGDSPGPQRCRSCSWGACSPCWGQMSSSSGLHAAACREGL